VLTSTSNLHVLRPTGKLLATNITGNLRTLSIYHGIRDTVFDVQVL